MRLLDEILEHNRKFVEKKEYEKYETTKYPNKRLVILSCMDTRLVELLPQAMNVKNGDVKIVKTAGAIVSHPFGSIVRSVLVALYELGADEVCVVGHYDCGMGSIQAGAMIEKMIERGIPKERIEMLKYSGVDLERWLRGFSSVEESVRHSVDMLKNHPLLPPNIPVHGLIIDPHTGKLDVVVNGYDS
ncbi:carbonic anhydrase [Thermolongibacillus altinsuensis]|jgi:carbonic anhydrase|uniref:carbonic anhydrase n=1 Tax=Thermolongibacillus altinsuensis TaxID=575256 RepID=A0A4R1QDB9_9BACL|nr:carbonic anhydrase [Thermolongibacillus altinsuensis]TCL46537.1 carbonic anhydrase [Thermolongibacillus altinsuensis]GMB09881.1 carbonic anhydrase [Thermolongibacillus altinsuensis]